MVLARRVLLVLALVALAGLYLHVAQRAMNPRVSEQYTAYYIRRTSTIPPGEFDRLRPLPAGVRQDGSSQGVLAFDDWMEPLAGTRWTDGPARIWWRQDKPLPGPQAVLEIELFSHLKTPVRIELNGRPLARVELPATPPLRIPLGAQAAVTGLNALSIIPEICEKRGACPKQTAIVRVRGFTLLPEG